MEITSNDIYLCYSITMKNYFKSNGIKYLLSGKDLRTDNVFYAYQKTKEVVDILCNWDSIKAALWAAKNAEETAEPVANESIVEGSEIDG